MMGAKNFHKFTLFQNLSPLSDVGEYSKGLYLSLTKELENHLKVFDKHAKLFFW